MKIVGMMIKGDYSKDASKFEMIYNGNWDFMTGVSKLKNLGAVVIITGNKAVASFNDGSLVELNGG